MPLPTPYRMDFPGPRFSVALLANAACSSCFLASRSSRTSKIVFSSNLGRIGFPALSSSMRLIGFLGTEFGLLYWNNFERSASSLSENTNSSLVVNTFFLSDSKSKVGIGDSSSTEPKTLLLISSNVNPINSPSFIGHNI